MAPVIDLILERLPFTLQLGGMALLFALLISFPIGIAGGLHQNGWQNQLAFATQSLFVSIPNFWLAIVLILFLSVKLKLAAGARLSGILLHDPAGHCAGGRDRPFHHPHPDDVARRGDASHLHRRGAGPRPVAAADRLFACAAQCRRAAASTCSASSSPR